MRERYALEGARFQAVLGNGGDRGQGELDFLVFLDGELASEHRNIPAQNDGIVIDLPNCPLNCFI